MPSLGKAYVSIMANLKPLSQGLSLAKSMTMKAMKGLGAAVRKTMSLIRRAIKWAMAAVTAAITGGIVAATKFETQLASVATMLDVKTMPILSQYRRELNNLAKQSGQSTATLSKGLYDILSASVDAAKAMDVLRISTRAAIAGMTDTEIAADAVTTILNSYQFSADKAAAVSDKLFATVKRGKLTFDELAGSIGRAAATSAIAGMSIDELLALTATLTRAGINANEAMTSITGTMRAFLNPSDDAVEAAKKFGLELSSNTLKTKGFLGAVKDLNKATPEQLVKIVPNIRAFKALAAALKDTAGFSHDFNLIANLSAGKTTEAYEKMSRTTGFKLRQLKESLLSVGRTLGKPMLGPLDDLTQFFRTKLGEIEGWLADNEAVIREWSQVVVQKIADIVWWVDDMFATFKEGGIGAALKKVVEDLKSAINTAFEIIWPHARKLGGQIAKGLLSYLKDARAELADKLNPRKYVAERIVATTPVAGTTRSATGESLGSNISALEAFNRQNAITMEAYRLHREALEANTNAITHGGPIR
jgi:TP901 family phage tail tape measure protein